ncbi:MAG: alkaline phosphatase family protein [Pseudomonadota bacterium]|nr:alkaline phosphatase family protein [Pseudomonadota bacterium]
MTSKATNGRKAVLIGLDGASWKLLDGFIDRGVMPTLGRLREEGAHGPLWSVVPPMTATAWTAFQTGKGPGKHGIYDWTEPVPGSYLYRPIDSTRIQSRTLFEQLSERGARVATVNLPLTYPARPINGIAVGDMLTPAKDVPGFTHPASFKAELDRIVPDYVIDTHLTESEDDVLPFLGRLHAMLEGRGTLVRTLMEQEPWDVFCTVWVEMDRMQHCLWHIFDPTHPHHDARLAAKYEAPILDIYRLIDTRVAEMIERRPADSNVIFLSDHGFGPCRYKVFLNTWLGQEGFLKFREGGRERRNGLHKVRGVLGRAGVDTRKLLDFAKRFGGDRVLRMGDELSRFATDIDWEHTQAFCHGTNSVRINLKGREPRGSVDPKDYDRVVEEVRQRLLAMRDPEGNRIITRVERRDRLYEGPEVHGAADLLIAGHDDSVWFYYSEGDVPSEVFEKSGWASGNHEPDGLFLGWGPDFAPGTHIADANIVDILPTLFATLGVPIPDDIDGRVLHEVFARTTPSLWTEARRFAGAAGPVRDAATDRAIEERLRGLGYLQ